MTIRRTLFLAIGSIAAFGAACNKEPAPGAAGTSAAKPGVATTATPAGAAATTTASAGTAEAGHCDPAAEHAHDAPGTATAGTLPPAPAGAPLALPGKAFGAGITLADAVSVDDILANPTAYDGKVVRVEGMVTDVCPKRGCWFELASKTPGKKLRFKVQDGVMTFPMEAKGQTAIAQGTIVVKQLSLEETRANAEYQAKEYGIPYDPASITAPSALVRIDGTGAVLQEPT
jgi:hypothetical protein